MEQPTHKTRANLIVAGQSNNSEASSSINSSDVSTTTGLHISLSSNTASLPKRWPPLLEAEQDLTAVGASMPTIHQASDEDDAKLVTIFEPTIQAKCISIQKESNAEQKPPEQPFDGRGRNQSSSSRGKGNDRSDIIQSTSAGTLIFGHGALEVDSIPTNKTAEPYEHRATSTRVINEEVSEDEEYIEEDIGVIQPQSGMRRLNPQHSPMKLRVKEIREPDEEKSILSRRRGRPTCPRCSKYLNKGHVCVLNNTVKNKGKNLRKIPEVDGVATDE